jgi:hypothetical protein
MEADLARLKRGAKSRSRRESNNGRLNNGCLSHDWLLHIHAGGRRHSNAVVSLSDGFVGPTLLSIRRGDFGIQEQIQCVGQLDGGSVIFAAPK